jgi:hypothetical protein
MSTTDPPPKTKNNEQYGSPSQNKKRWATRIPLTKQKRWARRIPSLLLIVFCFDRWIVLLIVFLFLEGDPCCSLFVVLGGGSALLPKAKNHEKHGSPSQNKKRWATQIPLLKQQTMSNTDHPPKTKNHEQHGGGSVLLFVFVLGGGSVLLIVFCFGRGIRAAPRFWLWEEDPCFSSFFVLVGGSVKAWATRIPLPKKKWWATRSPLTEKTMSNTDPPPKTKTNNE